MGFVLTMAYLVGVGTFGFLYYIIDNILVNDLLSYSTAGNTQMILLMFWHVLPIVVIVGGAVWLAMNAQKREVYY